MPWKSGSAVQIVLGRSWVFGEYVCELAHRVSAPEQIGRGRKGGEEAGKKMEVSSLPRVSAFIT